MDTTRAREVVEELWDAALGELQTNGLTDHARELLGALRSTHIRACDAMLVAEIVAEDLSFERQRVAQPIARPGLYVVK